MCIPILVTMFPEWLSGTEPLPHTPRTHPAPSVRPCCVCSVLCAHVQFCRFDKADAIADTAITDRHSDTTIFQLRAHWVRISWSIGSEKSFGHVPPVGVEPSILLDLILMYVVYTYKNRLSEAILISTHNILLL